MRRRRVMVGLAVLALAGALALAITFARPVPFAERVGRLGEGMTEAEVRAVLGPPGNHSRGYFPLHRGGWADVGWTSEWLWDDGYVSVWFADDGRAKVIYAFPKDPPPVLDRLRAPLGL